MVENITNDKFIYDFDLYCKYECELTTFFHNGECVATCPEGYKEKDLYKGNICEECIENCKTCAKDKGC